MRVQVPKSLRGGSLMGAHAWVKSQIVKTNPGSSDNYSIQSIDGTPLTLSDLTTRDFEEVHLISGVKQNPTASYPIPVPDYDYPSYARAPRIGNNVTELLPGDIEASMVERLVAQQGYFAAFNTIVRLVYTEEGLADLTDPKMAELLQRYANAQRHKKVKSNPSPFVASQSNQLAGVLSTNEAVSEYFAHAFGVNVDNLDKNFIGSVTDRVRVIKDYGLDNPIDIDDFVDDVLDPFLSVSIANAGLLQALQTRENKELFLDLVNKSSKSKYATMQDSPQYKKLLDILPIKSEDFYEGVDYGLVANPYFSRPMLAEAMIDEKFIKRLIKIVENAPRNLIKDAKTAEEWAERIRIGLLPKLRTMLNVGGQIAEAEIRKAQLDIIAVTKNDERQKMYDLLVKQIDANGLEGNLPESKHKIIIVQGISGFRPTPPPYWPRPVMYSIMDEISTNLAKILSKEDVRNSIMLAFSELFTRTHTVTSEQKTQVIRKSEVNNIENVMLGHLISILELVEGNSLDYNSAKDALGRKTVDDLKNMWNGYRNYAQLARGLTSDRALMHLAVLHKLIDESFGTDKIAIIVNKKTEIKKDADLDNVIPLMTIFMAIEETARNKYKYNVTENERAFILILLKEIFNSLYNQSPDTDTFEITIPDTADAIKEAAEQSGASAESIYAFIIFKQHLFNIRTHYESPGVDKLSEFEYAQLVDEIKSAVPKVADQTASRPFLDEMEAFENAIQPHVLPDSDSRRPTDKKIIITIRGMGSALEEKDLGLPYLPKQISDKNFTESVAFKITKSSQTLGLMEDKVVETIVSELKKVVTLIAEHRDISRSITSNGNLPYSSFKGQDRNAEDRSKYTVDGARKAIHQIRQKRLFYIEWRAKFAAIEAKLSAIIDSLSSHRAYLLRMVDLQGIQIETGRKRETLISLAAEVHKVEDLLTEMKNKVSATFAVATLRGPGPIGGLQITGAFEKLKNKYYTESRTITGNTYWFKPYHQTIGKLINTAPAIEKLLDNIKAVEEALSINLGSAGKKERLMVTVTQHILNTRARTFNEFQRPATSQGQPGWLDEIGSAYSAVFG